MEGRCSAHRRNKYQSSYGKP